VRWDGTSLAVACVVCFFFCGWWVLWKGLKERSVVEESLCGKTAWEEGV